LAEYLGTNELETLFSSIQNERDKLLARFLYESGCTVSEASELKTTNVHKDGTIIFSDRTARISTNLAHSLLTQAGSYIFHTRQTPNITPKRIQQILKPYLSAVHKGKVTPHLLRYTHIMHAYERGVPLPAIASQTGLTMVRLGQILADSTSKQGYNAFFEKEGES